MKTSTSLLPAASLALLIASPAHAALWTSGHGDIGIGYAGGALELHLHLGEDAPGIVDGVEIIDQEFEANELTILANNPVQINSTDPTLLSGIGTTTGSFIFLLPQSESQADAGGVPFVGIGTEELDPGAWGPLTITLDAVSGPGDFSVYQPDGLGGFAFFMSTALNGIDPAEDFLVRPAGTHDHFNMTFTEAGIYEVTFTASGTHNADGFKSSTETYTFAVPEPSTALLGLGVLGLALRRRRA